MASWTGTHSPNPTPACCSSSTLMSSGWSPVFSRVLALEYFFEEKQPLQFHVFDAEDGATSPRNDTFLGSTECTLGQIVSQTKVTKPLLLKNGKTAGKSTITVGKITCTHPWSRYSMPLHGHLW
uniref:cDNA FLJ52956, moderately similar to Copine-6 n=1 Tax=Homo sapiens TaxID=9606 RepID=B7Z289_HUMAN|nr:unnamed protein product [Homo sapiens]